MIEFIVYTYRHYHPGMPEGSCSHDGQLVEVQHTSGKDGVIYVRNPICAETFQDLILVGRERKTHG